MRITVLVSGNGTNLQAIIDAIAGGTLSATILRVISDRPDIPALKRAERAGIPTTVISYGNFPETSAFHSLLNDRLRADAPDWVVLAGFMRVLAPSVLSSFPNRIVNLHPSLLPAFPGRNAISEAYTHGVRVTGCTVHLVTDQLDDGPILAQRALTIDDEETLDHLTERMHALEHDLLVDTLLKLQTQSLEIHGRKARFLL